MQRSTPRTALECRQRWAALLSRRDYRTIITEVLEQELPKYGANQTSITSPLSDIMKECVLILASNSLVFDAAVEGDLALRYLTEPDLRVEYAEMYQRAHAQPSIYIHVLADQNGVSPTADQYMAIREIVMKYLDFQAPDILLTNTIDNISPPHLSSSSSPHSQRKFLRTAHFDHSSARISTLIRFCTGVLTLFTQTPPSRRNIPLRYPPTECGYSIHSPTRIYQHQHRHSSNYTMNLVEDTCTYLQNSDHPLFRTQTFTMHPFIIYLIFRPAQAQIAEVFISGLLQVWVDEGMGFNAYPAGRSNWSAGRLGEERWNEFEGWAREKTQVLDRIEDQRRRVEEMVKDVNEAAARIWREVLEGLDTFV